MKKDKTIYKCVGCNKSTQKLTSTLHEIVYGRGIRREYGIKYHLQAPACIRCHAIFHTKKKYHQKWLCRKMGFDYEKINLAVNTRNHKYLESIKKENLEKIKKYLKY